MILVCQDSGQWEGDPVTTLQCFSGNTSNYSRIDPKYRFPLKFLLGSAPEGAVKS